MFEDIINSLINEFGYEKVAKNMDNMIIDTLPEVSLRVYESLLEKSSEMLERDRLTRVGFESRLLLKWSEPFKLLKMMNVIALEVGENIYKEIYTDGKDKISAKDEVLIRTHARGCRIVDEIICLLKGGYSDAAFARWRTLHEIAVLCLFIEENNIDLSQRYLHYYNVESYYELKEYMKNQEELGLEPLDPLIVHDLENEIVKLKSIYGDDFLKPYGWAATVLDKKQRNFKGIEYKVGLNHLRPYYKLACNNVHSGTKGSMYNIALMDDYQNIILAGASNYGLADAGQNTAISLTQICASLVAHKSTYERLIGVNILNMLSDEVCDSFLKIQEEIEVEEKHDFCKTIKC